MAPTIVRLVSIHTLHPRLSAREVALFLDVDGTLLDIAARPELVVVDEELRGLLERAARAVGGALALVSGRSLAQLDQLFAPRRWPAAGLHGAERRDAAGRLHVSRVEPLPDVLIGELVKIAERHPGLLVENKGRAAALHYRAAPALRSRLESAVARIAESHPEVEVQPGSYVLELRPSGITKAHAIEAFLAEPPFAGRVPLFAGDDLTDLAGFDAVQRRNGVSVAVGPRVQAMRNLSSPQALRALLADLVAGGAHA
jgi:trehalose 6-phosphate phosphatase